jgi:hypothetical protein
VLPEKFKRDKKTPLYKSAGALRDPKVWRGKEAKTMPSVFFEKETDTIHWVLELGKFYAAIENGRKAKRAEDSKSACPR